MNPTWKDIKRLATMAVIIAVALTGCVVNPVPTPGAAEMSTTSDKSSGGGLAGNDGEFAQDAAMSGQAPGLSSDATATAASDTSVESGVD